MKTKARQIASFCCMLLLFTCSEKNTNELYVANIAITSPINNQQFEQQDLIPIHINLMGDYKLMNLYMDGQLIGTSTNDPYTLNLDGNLINIGKHKVIAELVTPDNRIITDTCSFKVSDLLSTLKTGTINDYEGNTYKTVNIGTQWWMAEDLRTRFYADGKEIELNPECGTGLQKNAVLFSDEGQYCILTDANGNELEPYAQIYNLSAAQKACPVGWHLPSDDEWALLEKTIGIEDHLLEETEWRGTNEGNKLKAKTCWQQDNIGLDTYQFSAFPGCNDSPGWCWNIGSQESGTWWTDTKASYVFVRSLSSEKGGINRSNVGLNAYYSVRCIKD